MTPRANYESSIYSRQRQEVGSRLPQATLGYCACVVGAREVKICERPKLSPDLTQISLLEAGKYRGVMHALQVAMGGLHAR